MAQSTQWGHVERGQFTSPHVYWAGIVLQAVYQYCAHSFARKGKIIWACFRDAKQNDAVAKAKYRIYPKYLDIQTTYHTCLNPCHAE